MASADPRAIASYARRGMRPRWPAYYLSATAGQVREGAWPALAVRELALDEYVWPLPGDVPYHRALGARPLAVDREGVRLGTALVVDASPQRLFHPDTTEVLETTVDDADDAAPVVLAVVAHLLEAGASRLVVQVPGPHGALGPVARPGLRHHGRGHGLRERGGSAGRPDPPHDARRVTGGDRGVAPPVGLSERRLSGSIGRRPSWAPPASPPSSAARPSWRWTASPAPSWPVTSWPTSSGRRPLGRCLLGRGLGGGALRGLLGGGPLRGSRLLRGRVLGGRAAERVLRARRGPRPSWSCRRGAALLDDDGLDDNGRLARPARRGRRSAGPAERAQAPAAEEPAGQVGHLTEGTEGAGDRRQHVHRLGHAAGQVRHERVAQRLGQLRERGGHPLDRLAHGGQHAAGRLRRLRDLGHHGPHRLLDVVEHPVHPQRDRVEVVHGLAEALDDLDEARHRGPELLGRPGHRRQRVVRTEQREQVAQPRGSGARRCRTGHGPRR